VLEVRPPVHIDKAFGVRKTCWPTPRPRRRARDVRRDDTTDLDAFRALAELAAEGQLQTVVRVGVRSDEGPAEISTRPTCWWTAGGCTGCSNRCPVPSRRRALHRLPQGHGPDQRRRGGGARRRHRGPRERRSQTTLVFVSVAGGCGRGSGSGRRGSQPSISIARLLGRARTCRRCRGESGPGVLNRCGAARGHDAAAGLALLVPQVPAIGAGFAILGALASQAGEGR